MAKPLVQSTGRRKRAVARVRLRTGEGAITINKRAFEEYFPSATAPDARNRAAAHRRRGRALRRRRDHRRRRDLPARRGRSASGSPAASSSSTPSCGASLKKAGHAHPRRP